MSKELTLAQKLNDTVLSVMGQETLQGFERAYLIANATQQLKTLLTSEYMKPIMALQGNKLGFKTDKDQAGGYPEAVVKNCLIEAVLTGVQPSGNQFNIIAGNTYITKEGFGYMLDHYNGLSYEIIHELPRINKESTSAAIVMNISWEINNNGENTRAIEFPIKINKYMGTDAVIGKANRKARAWLYSNISGHEISDGDLEDHDAPASAKINKPSTAKANAEKEYSRIADHIYDATTIAVLEQVEKLVTKDAKLGEMYEAKKNELVFNS